MIFRQALAGLLALACALPGVALAQNVPAASTNASGTMTFGNRGIAVYAP